MLKKQQRKPFTLYGDSTLRIIKKTLLHVYSGVASIKTFLLFLWKIKRRKQKEKIPVVWHFSQ